MYSTSSKDQEIVASQSPTSQSVLFCNFAVFLFVKMSVSCNFSCTIVIVLTGVCWNAWLHADSAKDKCAGVKHAE